MKTGWSEAVDRARDAAFGRLALWALAGLSMAALVGTAFVLGLAGRWTGFVPDWRSEMHWIFIIVPVWATLMMGIFSAWWGLRTLVMSAWRRMVRGRAATHGAAIAPRRKPSSHE